MMSCQQKSSYARGFTLIELLVTVIVGSLFILSGIQLALTINSLSITGRQQTTANNLAYSNLRKFVNGNRPDWFTGCDSTSPTALRTPNGWTDTNGTVTGLPGAVVQTVRASAPYGCGVTVRVESTVTYGSDNRSFTHVSYAVY